MNIVLFGYGKMGKYIYRSLKKNQARAEIYVVDPLFNKNTDIAHSFQRFEQIPDHIQFQTAFIATNSKTHCAVLKQVINRGIPHIFCEKPMCLTQKEYRQIQKICPDNLRLVVDYILRASPALTIWKQAVSQAIRNGYHIHKCCVRYCKDTRQDPRRFHDIGLYEDMYHVWDLCLNGPLFDALSYIQVLGSMHFFSPEIKNRCVEQQITCRVGLCQGKAFDLDIQASFQADRLDRSFICTLKKGKERVDVKLVFDQDGTDWCFVMAGGQVIQEDQFPAHDKLDRMIRDSLKYFKTGQKPDYIPTMADSVKLQEALSALKQKPPLRCRGR